MLHALNHLVVDFLTLATIIIPFASRFEALVDSQKIGVEPINRIQSKKIPTGHKDYRANDHKYYFEGHKIKNDTLNASFAIKSFEIFSQSSESERNAIYAFLWQGVPAEIFAKRGGSRGIKPLFRDRQGNGRCP